MESKNIPIAIGVLVLFLTIPAAVYLSTSTDSVKTFTEAGQEESSVFYLWPAEINTFRGEETEVRITLASPEEAATEAKVTIKYDPTALDITALEKGVIFNKYTKNEINTAQGQIEIQARGSFTGTGTLASVTFVPKERSETQLTIIKSGSKVKNENETDILQGVNGSVIIVE